MTTRTMRGRVLLLLERLLVTGAIVALGWAAFVWLAPAFYRLEHRGDTASAAPPARFDIHLPAPAEAPLAAGTLIGTLEIPRLGFSALVAEGDDDATLRAAVGHLPDTPLPWRAGNSALAGHRDAEFRPLRGIQAGDDLQLVTARGTFRYRIRATRIVMPNDLSVLEPTDTRTLTLITCYPFTYIGHAPKRFIVIAEAL